MGNEIVRATFTGSQGDSLAARLDLPPGRPRAFALFAHCFTCGKDIAAASRVSAGLVAEGYGVLRFDFTGLGSSEGEFANTNFSSNVADLVAAADHLRRHHEAPRLLVGHSLGGAAVLAAAGQIPEAEAVATIAAPSDVEHITGVFPEQTIDEIRRNGAAEVTLAGRSFTVKDQFLDDVGRHALLDAVGTLRRALLVMHSPVDELVGIDHARHIFEAARHPKSFVSLDDADHMLSNRRDAGYAARVLAAWAGRFVASRPVEDEPVEGVVVVEEAGRGGFAQLVRAGRHILAADEPPDIGTDTGPTPYDLVLAGLGACTSMTMRMYADRKDLALDHVRVTLSHEQTHVEDCAECGESMESGGGDGEGATPGGPAGGGGPRRCAVTRIDRRIEITGDLSDDDRSRLMAIAERCPVHRTLEGRIAIETSEVGV